MHRLISVSYCAKASNDRHFFNTIGDHMKIFIVFLSLLLSVSIYADHLHREELKNLRAMVAQQAVIAGECAKLLEGEFADTKDKQADCQYFIDVYFQMAHELRRMEQAMSSKKE